MTVDGHMMCVFCKLWHNGVTQITNNSFEIQTKSAKPKIAGKQINPFAWGAE